MKEQFKKWFAEGYDWIEHRTGVKALIKNQLTDYRLPPKLNKWYSLGGLSIFVLGLQLATGVLLLVYFVPSSEEAFASVERIMLDIPYGWLVRTAHAAGAHLMIVVLLLHMVSVIFMSSYKNPREITWLTGCALLFLTLGICFTGYLLPWSQLSYWATTVATSIPEPIPVIGPFIVKLVRGGDNINPDTLNRFFALHVVVIPAVMIALAGFHVLLVRILGISAPTRERIKNDRPIQRKKSPKGIRFFPTFVMEDVVVIFVFMAILCLGVFYYPEWIIMGDAEIPADPFDTPEHIKPEWYFLASYQFLKLVPSEIGSLLLQTLGITLFVLLPFLDSGPERVITQRPFFFSGVILLIIIFIALTVWGGIS